MGERSKDEWAAWRGTSRQTILLAFGLALLISNAGCVGPPSVDPARAKGIQEIRKGERAPADGYWISKRMLLMLYEAAERGVTTGAEKNLPSVPGPATPVSADTTGKTAASSKEEPAPRVPKPVPPPRD